MTLQEAQQKVDDWIKSYGVRYFNELTNMACLTEEVGELARVIARKYGEQSSRPQAAGSKFKVQGSKFKVQGSKFKVQGFWFLVSRTP